MKISGTGNSETRLNEITADDLATFRNYIIGFESGVINGFEEDGNKRTETSLTLSSGLMFAYSYVGYEDTKTFYFNKTSATQYHFIYGEIDRSLIPNTFELKVKNNQGGSEIKPTTFRQDVLSTVKTGVYQLPLYRVTLSSNGIEEITDLRDKKDYIKRVNYANITQKILKKISSTAQATTQNTSDNSDKVATTLFVHRACREYIDNDGGTIAYNVIITPRDVDETGKITFTPNEIVLSINNPINTFNVSLDNGYVIDDYMWDGGFTVTQNGNQFTVDLGNYEPTEDEDWYINFYIVEE